MHADFRPVVHLFPVGDIGNQMIRAMVALRIAREVEECRLSNIALPQWGMSHPNIPASGGLSVRFDHPRIMELPIEQVVQNLRAGNLERIEIASYAQHMRNFLPVDAYRDLLPDLAEDAPAFGSDSIVINIRGAEILREAHPDYTLVPVEFYREIVSASRLDPVFMGQLADNPYVAELRRAFPRATFIPSRGPLHDFSLIRRAHNVVVAVSTFSWCAAFLSRAARVVLPVTGFYSPAQFPEIDLLPLEDPRYEFYLFPVNYAVPVEECARAHRAIERHWRRVTPADLAAIRRRWPRVPVNKERFFELLDAQYYLASYPDVGAAVSSGARASALDHYVKEGFYQRRLPFRFDRVAYVRKYVDAALAIAAGEYAHPLHHFVERGRDAGYEPY
jgi:hypothetical protein